MEDFIILALLTFVMAGLSPLLKRRRIAALNRPAGQSREDVTVPRQTAAASKADHVAATTHDLTVDIPQASVVLTFLLRRNVSVATSRAP
jgi:hypothetical protein